VPAAVAAKASEAAAGQDVVVIRVDSAGNMYTKT
jgi:signal recognition particle GTPase